MRRRSCLPLVAVTLVGLATVLAAGCASTAPSTPDTIAVQLEGSGGEGLAVRVSSRYVRELAESVLGASLDGDEPLDPGLAALLGELDRGGPYARARIQRDGDLVRGIRRGRRLTLTVSDQEGGDLEVRMPWAVAECLLGRADTLRDALAKYGGRPVLEVRLAGAGGGRFVARLE